MKIAFMGDVMLGRLVNEVLKYETPDYPWGDVLDTLRGVDFRVCNLECVISDHGRPWTITPKVFHFRSDAKNVEALKVAGVKLVSVANNHTLDYEYRAMFEMLRILATENIAFAGAGKNIAEASSYAVAKVNDTKIGLIAFTDNEPVWEAKEDRPGLFYAPIDLEDKRAKKLFELTEATKDLTDILIVSAHWGPNWGYRPQRDHLPFARKLIDSGADIIFGHSCHVFQGLEIYKGKPIIYSAGDFVDDYAVDEVEKNDQSFIFVVETTDREIRDIKLYPTVIRNMQARMAIEPELQEIVYKMTVLCKEFNTAATWRARGRYLMVEV